MDMQVIVDDTTAALTAAGFVTVQRALSLNALPDLEDVPAVFYHPWKDNALADNDLTVGAHEQTVRERFAAVVVAPEADINARRKDVCSALLGKKLTGRIWATEYEQGEILALDEKLIWWRDVYATQVIWRNV